MARQDEAAAARAAGDETSLGLLPPEEQERGGVDPAQIMGVIGAVMGKSPAGRGLQAASGMMQQRAQAGKDRLARQKARMLQTEQILLFTDKTAANLEPLEKGLALYHQVRENYLSIVPGGANLLAEAEKNYRSMADSLVEYRAHSKLVDDFFQQSGGDIEATVDFVGNNLKVVNEEIFASKDRRNLAKWPDLIDWQHEYALQNFPKQLAAFEKCGGTAQCWMQHVDSRMPDGDGEFARGEILKMDVARKDPPSKAKASMVDTLRRHGAKTDKLTIAGEIESTERVSVTDMETGDHVGTYRKDDPRLEKYEGSSRYKIGGVQRQLTGTKAEVFGDDKVLLREMDDAEIAVRGFAREAARIKPMFSEEVLSSPGTVAAAMTSLSSQVKGYAKLADIWGEVDGKKATQAEMMASARGRNLSTIESIGKRFGDSAEARHRIETATLGLAWNAAMASGSGGRGVSDRELDQWISQIGKSATPRIFAAVLDDTVNRLISGFEDRIMVIGRRLPAGYADQLRTAADEIRSGYQPGLTPAAPETIEERWPVEAISQMSKTELEALVPLRSELSAEPMAAVRARIRELKAKRKGAR
jgi:hypothetical protein